MNFTKVAMAESLLMLNNVCDFYPPFLMDATHLLKLIEYGCDLCPPGNQAKTPQQLESNKF